MIQIPEYTKPNSLIESFLVKENEGMFRGISCKLISPGSDAASHFSLGSGLPTATKGESRCDLRLRKPLDYEARSSFVLQIIAEVSINHVSEA